MPIKFTGSKMLGNQSITNVFHGSRNHFLAFKETGYDSLGIHFGDLAQAKFFAKDSGQIIKANLHFHGLFDVGSSDIGWTSETVVAAKLREKMQFSVGIIQELFDEILAHAPSSLCEMEHTEKLSGERAARLIALLDAHGIDGIRYTNQCEPPGRTGGIACFVLRTSQIEVLDRDAPVSGKFDS